ncbi:MAG: cobalamin-dependent protein [Candidatus Magnetominusculus sp. LBB02]|nr:cobalamin-dependent protein [Candidatus Magnetominusculus sp. LBB02]
MNVLLVQQDEGVRAYHIPLYPIGLSYIAAALSAHNVRIFNPNSFQYPASLEELKKEIVRFNPDIVGLSIRNLDTTQRHDLHIQYKTVGPTIAAIRQTCPPAKIVVGGSGFSLYAREIMDRNPEIDFGVFLEGDESIVELLDNLDRPETVKGIFYRSAGAAQAVFTGARPTPDFSKIPMPRRDPSVIDMKEYIGDYYNILGVQSKRGCVFKCTYCSYPFLNNDNIRLRPPIEVVDEIEHMITNYGLQSFAFVDSVFNIPERHAKEICNEILRRGLKVKWGAWLSPKMLTVDLVLLMREAGCVHTGFSPDAVTDEGLKYLQKGITYKEVKNSIEVMRKVKGVVATYNFFCAYPGMDMRAVLRTIYLYFKIPLAIFARASVGLGWIRIEPHTAVYDTALKEGLITEGMDMLPEKEEDLSKLFYVPKRLWYATIVFDAMAIIADGFIKPVGRAAFRIVNRLKGRRAHV